MIRDSRCRAAVSAPDAPREAGLSGVWAGVLVCAVVFLSAFGGRLVPSVGGFAAFWPPNPLLLGLMVRWPGLSVPANWIAAACGYVAAGLLAGQEGSLAIWLSAADLCGVGTGVLLFRPLPEAMRRLERPVAVVVLCLVCGASALVAAAAGGATPLMPEANPRAVFRFWFTTEFVNAVILLPVILTAPDLSRAAAAPGTLVRRLSASGWRAARSARPAPALALAASCWLASVADGPGAIAFPVPALVWCALSYGLFATALATAAASLWTLVALAQGMIALDSATSRAATMASLQLGVALIAVGPLAVASVNTARNEALAALHRAVSRDFLTDALSRSAFMAEGSRLLTATTVRGGAAAVLMMDLDHFKAVNDRHGHGAGDRVLAAFAGTAAGELRAGDLLGRLGGEEFALVLPRAGEDEALAVAERVRKAVGAMRVPLDSGEAVGVTVSIGVACCPPGAASSLDGLLAEADAALYCAKAAGRNRVARAGHGPGEVARRPVDDGDDGKAG